MTEMVDHAPEGRKLMEAYDKAPYELVVDVDGCDVLYTRDILSWQLSSEASDDMIEALRTIARIARIYGQGGCIIDMRYSHHHDWVYGVDASFIGTLQDRGVPSIRKRFNFEINLV